MKKLLFLLVLAANFAYGQKADTTLTHNRIELFYGLNKADLYIANGIVGAGSFTTTAADAFGLNYVYAQNKHLSFETGVSLLFMDYLLTGAPGINYSENHQLSVLTIPLKVRVNFARYFFVNGGLIVDLEMMNTASGSLTGAGFSAGFGAKYDFKNGFGVVINPQFNEHSAFRKGTPSAPNITESSITFGLSMQF